APANQGIVMLRVCPSCGWQSENEFCPYCMPATIWTQPPKNTAPAPQKELRAPPEQPDPTSWIWSVVVSLLANWLCAYLGYSVYACVVGHEPPLHFRGGFYCSTIVALLLSWVPRSVWRSADTMLAASAVPVIA